MNKNEESNPWNQTEQPEEHPGSREDEKTYTHPAFGQISVSRPSGRTTLYGSDFVHDRFVSIKVMHSELHRSLNRDWPFGRKDIVELWMSEAQWAHFVSSFNEGSGVQCTLRFVAGETPVTKPMIPLHSTKEQFKSEFKEHISTIRNKAAGVIKLLETMEGLPVKKKQALMDSLKNLAMEIGSNLPFVEKSFGEEMEKTIEHAKIEINAHIESTIRRAGLDALAEKTQLLQLTSGEDNNE